MFSRGVEPRSSHRLKADQGRDNEEVATPRLVYLPKHSHSFIRNPCSPPEVDLEHSSRHFFRCAFHLPNQSMSSEVVNEVDTTVLVRGGLESTPDLSDVGYVQW